MGKTKYGSIRETVVEWCDCDDLAVVSTYQKKYSNRIVALAEKYPDEVKVVGKNADGTMCFHLPKRFVHVSIGERQRKEMSEEQKAAAAERIRRISKKTGDNMDE